MLKRAILIIYFMLFLTACATPGEDTIAVYNEQIELKENGLTANNQTTLTPFNDTNQTNNENPKFKINLFKASEANLSEIFSKPMGIIFDQEGNLFIVDQEKNKLIKFKSNGDYIQEWGFTGSSPGEFREPKYLTYTNDNKILITDTWNHRIQQFSSNGEVLNIFSDKLFGPKGITVYKDRIYFSDTGHHCIKILDKNLNLLNSFGKQGNKKEEFNEPTGLTVDDKGYIYIVDSKNNRIVKVSPDNKFEQYWQIKGWTDTNSGKESWLAYYKGKLYLSDPVLNTVRVFDTKGVEMNPVLTNIMTPTGITIYNDNLYVVESSKRKVIKVNINKG